MMKHLHKIKPTFISIFPLNTNLFEMLSSKLLKNLAYGLVFQHTSRGLDILMKHSSSCLIYYIKSVSFLLSRLEWKMERSLTLEGLVDLIL